MLATIIFVIVIQKLCEIITKIPPAQRKAVCE